MITRLTAYLLLYFGTEFWSIQELFNGTYSPRYWFILFAILFLTACFGLGYLVVEEWHKARHSL